MSSTFPSIVCEISSHTEPNRNLDGLLVSPEKGLKRLYRQAGGWEREVVQPL